MNPNWPENAHPDIHAFLTHLVTWAGTQPAILAAALVGSQARGQATLDSDVDLVLLVQEPAAYLKDTAWTKTFGSPAQIQQENWGKVTSVRVHYKEGLEVEFGFTDATWGSDPDDQGDARVIRDGIIVLFEQGRLLSKRVKRMHTSSP